MTTKNSLSSESSTFWAQSDSDFRSFLGADLLDIETAAKESSASEEEFLEKVKADLRQNYQFTLFSILPGLAPEVSTLKKLSKKMGIEPATAALFSYRLLKAGLWRSKDGRVETNFEFLNLGDISVKDYLSMTISIISHLSESESYSYDSLSLVTNRSLIRGFVGKVNQALGELHEKSAAPGAAKDCLFSWTHTGVIELEVKKKISNKDYEQ